MNLDTIKKKKKKYKSSHKPTRSYLVGLLKNRIPKIMEIKANRNEVAGIFMTVYPLWSHPQTVGYLMLIFNL